MQTLTDSNKLKTNLITLFDKQDWARVNELFPNKQCPTCDDTGTYRYDDIDHICNCELQKVLSQVYYGANIPKAYHTLSYDDFLGEDKDILISAIDEYVDNIKHNLYGGIGITFSGDIGNGKTMSACILGQNILKIGYSVYFIPFNDLIHAWANRWNNEEAKWLDTKLRSVQILIIDELATDLRNESGFLSNGLESIIRFRTSNDKPTIITTNLPKENEKKIFKKSFSLLSAYNERVETIGKDIRGDIIRQRRFELREKGERRPVC